MVLKKNFLTKKLFFSDIFTVCDPGYTLNADMAECEECAADSWKSLFGYEDCTACQQRSTTDGKTAQANNTCGLYEFKCYSNELQLQCEKMIP